jgi:hypothetical protein
MSLLIGQRTEKEGNARFCLKMVIQETVSRPSRGVLNSRWSTYRSRASSGSQVHHHCSESIPIEGLRPTHISLREDHCRLLASPLILRRWPASGSLDSRLATSSIDSISGITTEETTVLSSFNRRVGNTEARWHLSDQRCRSGRTFANRYSGRLWLPPTVYDLRRDYPFDIPIHTRGELESISCSENSCSYSLSRTKVSRH